MGEVGEGSRVLGVQQRVRANRLEAEETEVDLTKLPPDVASGVHAHWLAGPSALVTACSIRSPSS